MFEPSPTTGALRQGEILSDVIQVHVQLDGWNPNAEEILLGQKTYPQAIILTQDCDLLWDFVERNQSPDKRKEQKFLPNILFCELLPEGALRARLKESADKPSDLWKRIQQHRDERYHSFPSLQNDEDQAGEGLPPLVADFKRIFTIPSEELYLRLTLGCRRRAVLKTPFLQHFAVRFGYYLQRIALPEPHQGETSASTTAEIAPSEGLGGSLIHRIKLG